MGAISQNAEQPVSQLTSRKKTLLDIIGNLKKNHSNSNIDDEFVFPKHCYIVCSLKYTNENGEKTIK